MAAYGKSLRPLCTIASNTGSSIGERIADDFQHFGGCGLLFQASESSRVRCCSASNSRAFSIAITAWSAKVSANSICFAVKGLTSLRRI